MHKKAMEFMFEVWRCSTQAKATSIWYRLEETPTYSPVDDRPKAPRTVEGAGGSVPIHWF